jgi:hypothetical protein
LPSSTQRKIYRASPNLANQKPIDEHSKRSQNTSNRRSQLTSSKPFHSRDSLITPSLSILLTLFHASSTFSGLSFPKRLDIQRISPSTTGKNTTSWEHVSFAAHNRFTHLVTRKTTASRASTSSTFKSSLYLR